MNNSSSWHESLPKKWRILGIYPLVTQIKEHHHVHPFSIGKSTEHGPFSIANPWFYRISVPVPTPVPGFRSFPSWCSRSPKSPRTELGTEWMDMAYSSCTRWPRGWGKEVQVHVGLWVIYLVGGFNNNSGYKNNNSYYIWLYDGIITYTYLVGGWPTLKNMSQLGWWNSQLNGKS